MVILFGQFHQSIQDDPAHDIAIVLTNACVYLGGHHLENEQYANKGHLK